MCHTFSKAKIFTEYNQNIVFVSEREGGQCRAATVSVSPCRLWRSTAVWSSLDELRLSPSAWTAVWRPSPVKRSWGRMSSTTAQSAKPTGWPPRSWTCGGSRPSWSVNHEPWSWLPHGLTIMTVCEVFKCLPRVFSPDCPPEALPVCQRSLDKVSEDC